MSENSKGQNQPYFCDSWLEDNGRKSWLTKAPDKKQALCKLCKKNIELSNKSEKALKSHAAGKNHSEKDIKIKIIFTHIQKNNHDNQNYVMSGFF